MKNRKKLLSLLSGLLCLLMLLSLMGNVDFSAVRAATISELEDEIAGLEDENAEIEDKLADLRDKQQVSLDSMEATVAQKDLVDQEISLLNSQKILMNDQISAYSLLIADKQEELDEAQQKLTDLQQKYRLRIRAMEENGKLSYWSVLAGANSIIDMLDRLEMIQEIARSDEECLKELSAAAQEVANAKEEMTAEQRELQSKRDALDSLEAELNRKREEANQLLIDLKTKYDDYQTKIEDSEKIQEDLMAEIAQKNQDLEELKEMMVAKPPTHTGDNTWYNPVGGYYSITSPFGYRWHPIGGDWRLHSGIDLAGAFMTPILATRSGYVTTAAFQAGGAGNYVYINHGDGFGSIYMHMEYYVVRYGQYVEAGQVIGYMGTTGGSTGVHLHFGISYNGVYVNPVEYVNL